MRVVQPGSGSRGLLIPPLNEEVAVTRFVYVPAHLSEAAQWEMVKVLGLGEVPEG